MLGVALSCKLDVGFVLVLRVLAPRRRRSLAPPPRPAGRLLVLAPCASRGQRLLAELCSQRGSVCLLWWCLYGCFAVVFKF